MLPVKSVLVLSLLVSLVSSCNSDPGRACTQIGCVDGFMLRLEKMQAWDSGEYNFDIDIDGQKDTCKVTLPFANCDVSNPCTSTRVSLGLSGCALPQNQHGISEVSTSLANFKELKLKISRNGASIFDQSFRPVFKTSQPNGPGCEPICRNSSEVARF